jgi:hypothetical protein
MTADNKEAAALLWLHRGHALVALVHWSVASWMQGTGHALVDSARALSELVSVQANVIDGLAAVKGARQLLGLCLQVGRWAGTQPSGYSPLGTVAHKQQLLDVAEAGRYSCVHLLVLHNPA